MKNEQIPFTNMSNCSVKVDTLRRVTAEKLDTPSGKTVLLELLRVGEKHLTVYHEYVHKCNFTLIPLTEQTALGVYYTLGSVLNQEVLKDIENVLNTVLNDLLCKRTNEDLRNHADSNKIAKFVSNYLK